MRKLVKILLSLLLVAPAAALALGVGDVQLHSALNQRLDAEIELLSVDPAEADSIEVSLASYEDFARVGLERPSSLMFLQFDVQQSPAGEYFIKLSSREAIREPFLDFLVEVKWRSGRVLREYTLLLDPPVSHQEAAPVVTAPLTAPSTVTAPAVQEPAADDFVPPPSSIPVAPGYEAPAVATKPALVAPAETAPAAPPASASRSIVYGPVKANETLWQIAKKVRPEGVTDQQMMMALLIANPYAFIDNNINRLKKGYVLRIDDLSVLTAMSQAEAVREVSRQTRAWQDYRAAVAARKAAREPVGAPKDKPSAAVATAKKEPKLELVSPEGKAEQPGKATEGGDGDGVQQELMLALESSAAQRKENEALQKRLEGLETQLQDMQRLLSLKDADLAALQKQLREQGQALTLPSTSAEPAPAAKPAKPDSQVSAKEPAKAATETTAPDAAVPGTGADAATAAPQPAEKPSEADKDVEKPAASKTAPVQKPAVKKPPVVVPPEEPGFMDMVFGMLDNMGSSLGNLSFDDPMLMAAGGGAVLLILLLLLIQVRRRRSSGFQESILTGGTSSMMGAQDEEGNSETSFLSDLAISGMGKSTIHTDEDEVDPLTEADVFMAYGRYQQAEEVLKKALGKHPQRHELAAKLLEVYYHLQDKDKFVALAERSAAGLKSNAGEWARVAKMGTELSPGLALFAGAAAVSAATADAVDEEDTFGGDVLDIGLDLDDLTAEAQGTSSGGSSDLGFDLGLDLDDLDDDAAADTVAVEAETAQEPASDFEFDLDLGGESPEEDTGLNFDLGGMSSLSEETPAADNEFELDLGGEDDGLSLDFGDMSASGMASEVAADSGEEAGLDLGDLDDLDFGDLGLDDSATETATASDDSFDLDMSSLDSSDDDLSGLGDLGGLGDLDDEGMFGDSDEIATKLDLAQAYIEMGDSDGARSMLEEVAEGGNEEQKQQAQELLARI